MTPSAIGEVTVEIPVGVATDSRGNENQATRVSLGITYDDDGNGGISKAEAIAAIRDYFGGNLTKAQAIAVIRLYFTSWWLTGKSVNLTYQVVSSGWRKGVYLATVDLAFPFAINCSKISCWVALMSSTSSWRVDTSFWRC